MLLVIFTGQYPYGIGEDFLEDELRCAEKEFERIIIVTYAKTNDLLTKYVPQNAEVVALRRDESLINQLLPLFLEPFKLSFWREVISGCRERGINNVFDVITKILLFEKRIQSIKRKWDFPKDKCLYYSYWINPAALFLARQKRKIGSVCIARCHGEDCFFDRGYIPWRKMILENLDMVFPVSEKGKEDIIAHYADQVPCLREKLYVANLGVNVPVIDTDKKGNNSEPIIVTCSNVIALKRLDLLIEALEYLSIGPIKWIHFGDGPLFHEIERLARERIGNKEGISYEFKGRVPVNEVLNFYSENNVDLFINCSDVEGIPVSAMEAMSYGIPVIARNVGGVSELIDNETGYLLNADITAEELANAIKLVLFSEDGTPYRVRANNSRKRIELKYDKLKNYELFFSVTKGLLTEADED